ncbi:MAG TPA: hypothetical protein VGJ32_10560 [Solirubrobacteraceae bacterium]
MGSQFRFVQLEYPWPLGPEDGRYVLRRHAGEEPDHVLVLRTLGAPQRRLLGGRRPRRAESEPPPAPVTTSRATLVDAVPLADAAAAAAWLEEADRQALVDAALRMLNGVLHLHRMSVADPRARDVTQEQALVVRVGYGAGEEVADGRYAVALELPPPRGARVRRSTALRPQERLAALLSGRDAALACEELALHARADLDAGRSREAALVLRPALEAALSELEPWAERGDLRERLAELAGLRADALVTYDRALQSGLDDREAATVDRVLRRVEAALRARTASGLD